MDIRLLPRQHLLPAALVLAIAATWLTTASAAKPTPVGEVTAAAIQDVVPIPVSVQPSAGVTFTLPPNAVIVADSISVGDYLASILRPSTGYALPVQSSGTPNISLLLSGASPEVGSEGYQLNVTTSSVVIRALTPAGLFHGVQTLRQLFPPAIEASTVQTGPWTVPGGQILDYPRYPYRGTMLDVSRHFFGVDTVKRYIDEVALYKINTLHLHLSDDQGWRIVIDSWPRLATHGGSTQVGGGPGGYYTKAQFSDIVAYAASRHITIVPEIDMPGHTNAALSSYAELNCNGIAPPLYTGTDVGFSSLCTSKEVSYTFVANVLAELAALTPGPYLHIGGDEANTLSDAQYTTFVNRVQPLVTAQGKKVIGWHQIGLAQHEANRVVQYWGTRNTDADVKAAVAAGAKVIMSPANKAYLDMKYNSSTQLGLNWAGYIEVRTAYDWDPATKVKGIPAAAVIGIEAPLWSETLVTLDHIEFMAFPRLPALAELGWSPSATHNWTAFSNRLGTQGPRWTVMGIDFYRSSQVPWR